MGWGGGIAGSMCVCVGDGVCGGGGGGGYGLGLCGANVRGERGGGARKWREGIWEQRWGGVKAREEEERGGVEKEK